MNCTLGDSAEARRVFQRLVEGTHKTVWGLEAKMPTRDKLSDLSGNEIRQCLAQSRGEIILRQTC